MFSDGFERFLMENPEEARIILNKAMLACRARNAAKRAREITRTIVDKDFKEFETKKLNVHFVCNVP